MNQYVKHYISLVGKGDIYPTMDVLTFIEKYKRAKKAKEMKKAEEEKAKQAVKEEKELAKTVKEEEKEKRSEEHTSELQSH